MSGRVYGRAIGRCGFPMASLRSAEERHREPPRTSALCARGGKLPTGPGWPRWKPIGCRMITEDTTAIADELKGSLREKYPLPSTLRGEGEPQAITASGPRPAGAISEVASSPRAGCAGAGIGAWRAARARARWVRRRRGVEPGRLVRPAADDRANGQAAPSAGGIMSAEAPGTSARLSE